MDATPNHTPTRATQRMEYVLLHRRTSSAIHRNPSEALVPSSQGLFSKQSSADPPPLGRGHRVKKPNIRLSLALPEPQDSENEPRRPRGPVKRSRRVSHANTVEGPRIWCHQCHQDRSNESTIACQPCGKSYCYTCMARRYGECITQDQHDNWTCPRCQNYCDCIKCIRIRKACGTSSPSAPTLPTTRRVSGESRLTRARAKKRPTESTAFTETSPPAHELDITTGVDRDGPAVEDALYDFKAPSETAEMKVEGWTPADIQGAGNASYETLAFQTYLRLASDSTLLSTPTSSSALPSTPHASLQTFGSDDSAFDPLKALKSFPTANEPPTHSISPLELTSDFSSMLAYSYSPTIPQTVVDEYGITGVVPINRPIPETSPKMGMKHGALMLVDVSLAENYPLDEDRLGCALGPPSEPSHPPSTLLGDADMDAVSRFLNDEMFDEI